MTNFSSIWDILNIPLGFVMRICYTLVDNYFIALLLFALIMQIVLLPLAIKQQKNSIRQASLQPKIAAIRKKYAGRNDAATQQKMQEETMEFYKRENFNPASGCLPMLIQLPVMFALYYVIMNPLRYITGLTTTQISELQTFMTGTQGIELNARGVYIEMMNHIRGDIPSYTSIVPDLGSRVIPDMMLGNVDLSAIPSLTFKPFDWLMIIPVLSFVFALLSQIVTKKFTYQSPETADAQNNMSMKILQYSAPLLSVWIAFSVPAGIGLYWIFRNIIATVQQIILARAFPIPHFTEEEYKAAEREMKTGSAPAQTKKRSSTAVPPRSLHHIDDEEYQAKYEAAMARAEAAAEEKAKEDDRPKLKDENRHD